MAYVKKYQKHEASPWTREQMPQIPSPSLLYHSSIYQRSVFEWEKQFGMRWRSFLERKECILQEHKIMRWNDSACMESFRNAESRFWAKNPSTKTPLPSPDMYIDQIDWNCEIDPQIVLDLEATLDHVQVQEKTVIPLEQIKPTGWDIIYEEPRGAKCLTGMIVGDDGSYDRILENRVAGNVPMKSKTRIHDQGGNYSKFTAKSRYKGKSVRQSSYTYRPVSKPRGI